MYNFYLFSLGIPPPQLTRSPQYYTVLNAVPLLKKKYHCQNSMLWVLHTHPEIKIEMLPLTTDHMKALHYPEQHVDS